MLYVIHLKLFVGGMTGRQVTKKADIVWGTYRRMAAW